MKQSIRLAISGLLIFGVNDAGAQLRETGADSIRLPPRIYKTPSIVERHAPAEWKNLVLGGRFMDRYLPMPDLGGMTTDTWGADNVIPRDVNNGIESPEWDYWGGNTILGTDGQYHLMVCRWHQNRNDALKDPVVREHLATLPYANSQVIHAVSDSPYGPFRFHEKIGIGHNAEWYLSSDGTYVIYVIDYCYTSKSIDGPWKWTKLQYDSRDRKNTNARHYLHNCTFAQREDGSFLMISRHGQAWFSRTGTTPYNRVSPEVFYPKIAGKFEDPVVWKTNIQYHLIVNDWQGRIAYYMRSKDGVNWILDAGEAYVPGISMHVSGLKEHWFKYERIKVFQDEYGRAIVAQFAVSDTCKRENEANDNHGYKHICVPLTAGRLLSVENSMPINVYTKHIRVRVNAEDGFDPHNDMDIESLRFGAAEEVDFGRGSKVIDTEKSGPDMILVFDGTGNGLTDDNFVGKLLGKTAEGKLLFGWSRLPGVKYIEPILSSRMPEFEKGVISVEVQNFGQVASHTGTIEVEVDGKTIGIATVRGLEPFENAIVEIPSEENLSGEHLITVRTACPGRNPEVLSRTVSIN